jgi:hypothetical protein
MSETGDAVTAQQVEAFLREGAVTLDTPFTPDEVAAAAAALERLLPPPTEPGRYRASRTCDYFDEELLALIQHPFLEETAKRMLAAPAVTFLQTAALATYPQPEGPFTFDQHVDLQYTRDDLDAIPRRIVCSYFIWLSDVTETRAPMMFRPGTHRPLADHWQGCREPAGATPRVHGIPLADLPGLDYPEPQPVLARAGQATALTTAAVHGASVNLDSEPRRALVVTFTAAGVVCGLPPAQQEAKERYDARLRAQLRPDRRHLVAS